MKSNKIDFVSFYKVLWKCKLEIKDSSYSKEYRDVVFYLFFLRLASYVCDKHRSELVELFGEDSDDVDNRLMYSVREIIYIKNTSHWEHIMKNIDEENLCEIVDNALQEIGSDNRNLAITTSENTFIQFVGKEETIRTIICEIDGFNEIESVNKNNLFMVLRIIQRVCQHMF